MLNNNLFAAHQLRERSIVHSDVVAPSVRSVGPEGWMDPSEGEHIHWRVSERIEGWRGAAVELRGDYSIL